MNIEIEFSPPLTSNYILSPVISLNNRFTFVQSWKEDNSLTSEAYQPVSKFLREQMTSTTTCPRKGSLGSKSNVLYNPWLIETFRFEDEAPRKALMYFFLKERLARLFLLSEVKTSPKDKMTKLLTLMLVTCFCQDPYQNDDDYHVYPPKLATLRSNNADGNQNANFARASHFFCTFFSRFCMSTKRKCLISRFMEEVNKQRRNFYAWIIMVTWNSASGGFA